MNSEFVKKCRSGASTWLSNNPVASSISVEADMADDHARLALVRRRSQLTRVINTTAETVIVARMVIFETVRGFNENESLDGSASAVDDLAEGYFVDTRNHIAATTPKRAKVIVSSETRETPDCISINLPINDGAVASRSIDKKQSSLDCDLRIVMVR